MLSPRAAFGLPETIKHMRQEFRADPLPFIAHLNSRGGALASQRDPHHLSNCRELNRVCQQVPDDLPHPMNIA